ncbi:hypothetical protein ACFYSF_17060 [Streptomyces canus]|uniref:hypothetical protein n=1 Tax=Streptomyces canus TaxID=58343 RepID=UPI00368C39B6
MVTAQAAQRRGLAVGQGAGLRRQRASPARGGGERGQVSAQDGAGRPQYGVDGALEVVGATES